MDEFSKEHLKRLFEGVKYDIINGIMSSDISNAKKIADQWSNRIDKRYFVLIKTKNWVEYSKRIEKLYMMITRLFIKLLNYSYTKTVECYSDIFTWFEMIYSYGKNIFC